MPEDGLQEGLDWTTEAQELTARLRAVETAATTASIPPQIMAELKSAVDHCRTALWATMVAPQSPYESATAIIASRMTRVEEMCRRMIEDVTNGRIWRDTPGIAACHTALADAQKALQLLFKP